MPVVDAMGDLRDPASKATFESLGLVGSYFFGCVFPADVTTDFLFHKGAKVVYNPAGLPFKPFRATMYEVRLEACRPVCGHRALKCAVGVEG